MKGKASIVFIQVIDPRSNIGPTCLYLSYLLDRQVKKPRALALALKGTSIHGFHPSLDATGSHCPRTTIGLTFLALGP